MRSVKPSNLQKRQIYLHKGTVMQQTNNYQIGDVFISSWGYDQTNINAYQLISITKSGKTGTFRPIDLISVETTSWASDRVKPDKDNFISEETFKSRFKDGWINVKRDGYAKKVDDLETTYHRSWSA
jgi:hypothetical protein